MGKLTARLVAAGHRHAEVMGYTLAQARGFLAAHGRLEGRQNALRLALHAVAAQGDRAAIERLQRDLWEDVRP